MEHIQIEELMHVNVEVSDLERALAFYALLGLEELPRAGTPGRAGAWFRLPDGKELHISVGEPRAENRSHFAIRVADIETARRIMRAAGARIETEREIPGMVRFFARDPDGNRIEFMQRL
jgi:catechol 2,3-dioxygenase-like lactoylglutathione lyase family enzyme